MIPISYSGSISIQSSPLIPTQGGDLVLNPTDLQSLKNYLEKNPENFKELEKFVSEELETRLIQIEKLLLYDPLTSPRGILLAHLTMIARERPSIYAYLLATDWTQEDEIEMLIPSNPERNELIQAITFIAWFAEDLPSTISVFREYTRIDLYDHIVSNCKAKKLLPTFSSPEDIREFTSKNPSIGLQLLLYAQRSYVSSHFPSYDPSRHDHWEGRNLPWAFDSIVVRSEWKDCPMDWDKILVDYARRDGSLRACTPEAVRSWRTLRISNPEVMEQAFLNKHEADGLSLITGSKTDLQKYHRAFHSRITRIYTEWLGTKND